MCILSVFYAFRVYCLRVMCNPTVNENSGTPGRVETGNRGSIGEVSEKVRYSEF